MPPQPDSRYWTCRGKRDDDGVGYDGKLYLAEREPLDPAEIFDGTELTHVVTKGESLPQLAGLYWITGEEDPEEPGPEHWWWILADLNDLDDLTLDLEGGTVLRVPTLQTVREKILNR
jgi:hypothetical protein